MRLFILIAIFVFSAVGAAAQEAAAKAETKKYVPVADYDPKRNAAEDLKLAVAEAQRTNKHILLEVGGKWCVWCRIMDAYFEKNPDLLDLREKNYILLKVNVSEENENAALLSQYPAAEGYPHIYVLDSSGKLLHSQNTAPLEEGKTYHKERFTEFLNKWKPAEAQK
jgi:thiol:disulfide interchange protein